MRTFEGPSGRRWTASLFFIPAAFALGDPRHPGFGCPAVLRFRTDGFTLDLVDWPDDWARLPDEELLALTERAGTSTFGGDGVERYAMA